MEHSEAAIETAKGSTWDLDRYAENHAWLGVGIIATQHRDSDVMDKSNWDVILTDLNEKFANNFWDVARLNHWAVGWVEFITYNTANSMLEEYTEEIRAKLEDYPVLDEMKYSEMEWNENHPADGKCYDPDCDYCGLEKA